MAVFSTRKGLFGAPMMAASPDAAPITMDATAPTYKKPSTGRMIAGIVGDTLAQWGGGRGTFLPTLMMREKAALDAQQEQAQRATKFADWQRQYDYERANPKSPTDDTFTRTLSAAGIDPSSPEARELYRQRATTLASPAPQFIPDGNGGGRFVVPPVTGAGPPTAPVGKLKPIGGAAPGGPRTFPVR